MGRFAEAISEGDGISVVPVLEDDVGSLAEAAEQGGAEALGVPAKLAGEARAATSLPLVVDGGIADSAGLERLAGGAADGWIVLVDFEEDEGGRAAGLVSAALELGIDCAVEIREAESLADVLERLDPEIVVIAHPKPDDAEEELEHILDLLPDVPAGKLVVARVCSELFAEQVVALERAGVDAVLVGADVLPSTDLSAALAELTGR